MKRLRRWLKTLVATSSFWVISISAFATVTTIAYVDGLNNRPRVVAIPCLDNQDQTGCTTQSAANPAPVYVPAGTQVEMDLREIAGTTVPGNPIGTEGAAGGNYVMKAGCEDRNGDLRACPTAGSGLALPSFGYSIFGNAGTVEYEFGLQRSGEPLVDGLFGVAGGDGTNAQYWKVDANHAGSTRLDQIGSTTVATGNGVVGAGVQRVAIASDNSAVPTSNAVLAAIVGTYGLQVSGIPVGGGEATAKSQSTNGTNQSLTMPSGCAVAHSCRICNTDTADTAQVKWNATTGDGVSVFPGSTTTINAGPVCTDSPPGLNVAITAVYVTSSAATTTELECVCD